MLIETFIRKQLGLKAHRVTAVQLGPHAVVIQIDAIRNRRLRWSRCGSPGKPMHDLRPRRQWRDLVV